MNFIEVDLSSRYRGVAQTGSAPAWGAGGRRFKSSRPDHRLFNFCLCDGNVHQTSKIDSMLLHFKMVFLKLLRYFFTHPSYSHPTLNTLTQ